MARESCHTCVHFYITWEKTHPYGCRAMGFKSRHFPSRIVYQSSGRECLLYTPKDGESVNQ